MTPTTATQAKCLCAAPQGTMLSVLDERSIQSPTEDDWMVSSQTHGEVFGGTAVYGFKNGLKVMVKNPVGEQAIDDTFELNHCPLSGPDSSLFASMEMQVVPAQVNSDVKKVPQFGKPGNMDNDYGEA